MNGIREARAALRRDHKRRGSLRFVSLSLSSLHSPVPLARHLVSSVSPRSLRSLATRVKRSRLRLGRGCGKESDEREADVVVPTVIHALRALYTHNIRLSLGSFHRPVPPLHRPVPIPPRYPPFLPFTGLRPRLRREREPERNDERKE